MGRAPAGRELTNPVRVAYVGNFEPEHSTENHIARALRATGITVLEHQENLVDWLRLADEVADVDFVLWTHTHGYAPEETHDAQQAFLDACVPPTVAYHLDRWWGLAREHQTAEPYFRCDLVVTADGGHDEQWERLGVDHVWFPPGVSAGECVPVDACDAFRSPLAFVGSWQSGYHPEWHHRRQLVKWLKRTYRDQVAFWPRPGEHAVRGERLRQLYASVDVVIGDSCLVGDASRYWSDRIPETLGRGGFLIHPWVEGMDEHFGSGEHLLTWHLGEWNELASHIEQALDDPAWRRQIADAGRVHVLEHHTYEVRMRQLVDLLGEQRLLSPVAA